MANGQTSNYGLNQWIAEDLFLREEFNADNSKLDEALTGLQGQVDALESGISFGSDLPAILVGVLVAFVSGYLSIRFFLKLIGKATLNGFALYMTMLGVVTILLQVTGVLQEAPAAAAQAFRLLLG